MNVAALAGVLEEVELVVEVAPVGAERSWALVAAVDSAPLDCLHVTFVLAAASVAAASAEASLVLAVGSSDQPLNVARSLVLVLAEMDLFVFACPSHPS